MTKQVVLIFFLVVFYHLGVAQNVGIGTPNPTRAKLEVHGAVDATSAIFGESYGISIQRNWPGIGFNSYFNTGYNRLLSSGFGAKQVLDPNSGYLLFDMLSYGTAGQAPASTRALVISPEGRVHIGSADVPAATLSVTRGTASQGTAMFVGTKHHSHFNYGANEDTYIRAGKDNSKVIINDIPNGRVAIAGMVGINIVHSEHALEIGQINNEPCLQLINNQSNGIWGFYISPTSGGMILSFGGNQKGTFNASTGAYSSISDKRLKKNIQAMPSMLEKVMELKPVNYEMIHNNPGREKSMGFIAQDVKKLFPELVTVTKDTAHNKEHPELQAIDYSGFGTLAIKAIQEQQATINDLQKRLELQEKQSKVIMDLLNNKK